MSVPGVQMRGQELQATPPPWSAREQEREATPPWPEFTLTPKPEPKSKSKSKSESAPSKSKHGSQAPAVDPERVRATQVQLNWLAQAVADAETEEVDGQVCDELDQSAQQLGLPSSAELEEIHGSSDLQRAMWFSARRRAAILSAAVDGASDSVMCRRALDTLRVLSRAEVNKATMWSDREAQHVLLQCVEEGRGIDARVRAMGTIRSLACAYVNQVVMWRDPDFMTMLHASIEPGQPEALRVRALGCIRSLAFSSANQSDMWHNPRTREALLASAAAGQPELIRMRALGSLHNLACNESNQLSMWSGEIEAQIVSTSSTPGRGGAAPSYRQLLLAAASEGESEDLRKLALGSLANLSSSPANRNQMWRDGATRTVLLSGADPLSGQLDSTRSLALGVIANLVLDEMNRDEMWECPQTRAVVLTGAAKNQPASPRAQAVRALAFFCRSSTLSRKLLDEGVRELLQQAQDAPELRETGNVGEVQWRSRKVSNHSESVWTPSRLQPLVRDLERDLLSAHQVLHESGSEGDKSSGSSGEAGSPSGNDCFIISHNSSSGSSSEGHSSEGTSTEFSEYTTVSGEGDHSMASHDSHSTATKYVVSGRSGAGSPLAPGIK